jgi:hypothetical protein
MDHAVVTVGRTTQFPGVVVTAGKCGLDDGDSREDSAVPRCGGDGRAAWTRLWRRRWRESGTRWCGPYGE